MFYDVPHLSEVGNRVPTRISVTSLETKVFFINGRMEQVVTCVLNIKYSSKLFTAKFVLQSLATYLDL